MPAHMKSENQKDAFVCVKNNKYLRAIERIPSFVDVLITNTFPREGECPDQESDFALAKKIDNLKNLQIHIHSAAKPLDDGNYVPKRYVSVQAPLSADGEFAIIRI